MYSETNYTKKDLKHGKCRCCNEISDEIFIGIGLCIDCIEAQKFYDETMKDFDNNKYKHNYNKFLF